jgi:plastocyanin
MRRTALTLLRLGAGLVLVVGGAQVLTTTSAEAATAVAINGVASCSGTIFCYAPATVTVSGGDTVTWTNQSGAPHTVSRCDPSACNGTDGGTGSDPAFDISVASANGTAVNQTFNGTGTYNYYCKIHGFAVMHGTVTVQGPTPDTAPSAPTPDTTPAAPAASSAGPASAAPTAPPATADSTLPTAPPAQPLVSGDLTLTG